MKRHVQTVGVRSWAGDDLVELQREPLAALDAFFAEYGPCIVQGCEISESTDGAGTFDVAPGLVALEADDQAAGLRRVMVMPFLGASGVALPLYLTAAVETLADVYGDGKSKPIAYVYTAQASGVDPGDEAPHLTLAADGGNRFVDAVQDAGHRFVSDEERARWNRVLEQAKTYADAKDAAALAAAKAYADETAAALVNGSPEQLDTLQELAAALGDDPNFSATVMQMLGERVTSEALLETLAAYFKDHGASSAPDLDSATEPGSYYYVPSSAHRPPSDYGTMLVFSGYGGSWLCQLAVGTLSGSVWYRSKTNEQEWSAWREFWHAGNFDPAGKADAPTTILNGDANSLTHHGLYALDGILSNSPCDTANLRVLVIAASPLRVTQIAQPYDSDRLFFRRKIDGIWHDWREVFHSGNHGSGSGLDADLWDGVQLWRGSKAQYDALSAKDANTLYIVTD